MLDRLEPFVGEWDLEVSLPSPDEVRARAVFEWALDGRFLVQRVEISIPEAPNSIALIGADPGGDAFTQHYYDSRGVARLYAMTFTDDIWSFVAAGTSGVFAAKVQLVPPKSLSA